MTMGFYSFPFFKNGPFVADAVPKNGEKAWVNSTVINRKPMWYSSLTINIAIFN